MKKILSLMMAMLFLIFCLPLTALAEGEAAPEAISGSYNSEAAAYIWQFGEMSATEQTSVSYSDSYAAIQIGLAAGDGISSDGITFTGAGCLESDNTDGLASAAESGRYLLVRPTVNGTLGISVSFAQASNNRKCRIYYQDFGELATLEAVSDLSLLKKEGDNLGETATSATVTWTLALTAGHVYGFVLYNESASQITALQLSTNETPGGSGE